MSEVVVAVELLEDVEIVDIKEAVEVAIVLDTVEFWSSC